MTAVPSAATAYNLGPWDTLAKEVHRSRAMRQHRASRHENRPTSMARMELAESGMVEAPIRPYSKEFIFSSPHHGLFPGEEMEQSA